jgi:hypothetical protein
MWLIVCNQELRSPALVQPVPANYLRLVSEIRLSFVRPVITAKRRGIVIGDAHFADHRVLRFRVTGLDPVAVQLIPDEALPQHQAAIEAWIAASRGDQAA